jgi:hypothetical protein
MSDLAKQDLKGIVFVAAHNTGELSEEVQRQIDAFDVDTYRRFLRKALERREEFDRTGEIGGGTFSASRLREALENLELILSR